MPDLLAANQVQVLIEVPRPGPRGKDGPPGPEGDVTPALEILASSVAAAAGVVETDRTAVDMSAAAIETARAEVSTNRTVIALDRAATAAERAAAQTARAGAEVALAAGSIVVDLVAALAAETTAKSAVVRFETTPGDKTAGTYGRATPGDTATAWIQLTAENVFTLAASVLNLNGAVAPSVGAPGALGRFVETAAVDKDGRPVSVLLDGGGQATFEPNGAMGLTVSDLIAPSAGWTSPESAEPTNYARVDLDGVPLGAAPNVVPHVGWLPGMAGLADRVTVDADGAPVGRPASVPHVGYWDPDDPDSLIVDARVDLNDNLIDGLAEPLSGYAAAHYVAAKGGKPAKIEGFAPAPILSAKGQSGWLPPTKIKLGSRIIDVPAYVYAGAAPASIAVTENIDLIYNSDTFFTHQFVRGLVLNGKTAGVDYRQDDRGAIVGLINTATVNLSASYTGHKVRTDVVTMHVRTRAMTTRTGVEVARNANYLPPTVPADEIVIWRIFRHVDGSEAAPVHLFKNRVRLDRAADTEAVIARMARRLPKTRRKIASGAAIKFGGYGDSITATGGGGAAGDLNTTANGPFRDIKGHYQNHSAEALATIETFNFGDAAGNSHVKTGFNWSIVRFLEKLGITVTYENRGIGGTTTANTGGGAALANGSQFDRLAAAVAAGYDFVVVAFGMNELFSSATYANLLVIVKAFTDAGTEVILLTPPRPNPLWFGASDVDGWRYTTGEIARAADDLNVACVDASRLYDPRDQACLGLSDYEICPSGLRNHPDVPASTAVGDLLVELLAA